MENDLGKTIVISLAIVSVILGISYFIYDYNLNQSVEIKLYNDCYNSCSIIYQGNNQEFKYLEIECERECLYLLNKSMPIKNDALLGAAE